MKEFIKTARELAYSEVERTGMPLKQHIDLSCEKAKQLANELGANVDIVEASTLLMDSVIGTAIQEGRISEHVNMCLEKANELLEQSELDDKTKENIRYCVSEHHGVDKFYSLESEICCNADCFRFASTKGFFYTVRFLRDMPIDDFIKLLRNKFDEKKNALTLDTCKQELKDELVIIDEFISKLEK
ncbi:hypothetical protein ACFL13_02530 [Patescibacteria group bacterium]